MAFGKYGESSLGCDGPGRILNFFLIKKEQRIKFVIWILSIKKINSM